MTHRNETGSATVEAVIGATALVLFLSLAVLGGRLTLARQAVESAAADAARVRCTVTARDLGLPGGTTAIPVEVTVTSSLDTYRAR